MFASRPEISPESYDKLLAENQQFQIAHQQFQIEIQYLKFELEKLKKMIFGAKSERFITADPAQLSLAIDFGQEPAPEPEKETISYTRNKADGEKKKGHARLELPSHLPQVNEIIEPENLPTGAKLIGKKVTSVLEYIPGKAYVRNIVRPQYIIENEDNQQIVIADLPSLPIPHGNAGPSFLAHISVSKFLDHLPFYRQSKMFQRQQQFHIAESVLGDSFSKACETLVPMYEVHRRILRQSKYLMADETPIAVLSADKPGSTHQGYFWVYYSPPLKLVYFDYHRSRGQDAPKQFLNDYQGSIQADGYQVYDMFENKAGITLLACMAHARRYFYDARNNDKPRSEKALEIIQRLYKIEERARVENLTTEERKTLRQIEAIPILNEFKTWLDSQLHEVLPKSPIGKAMIYTLRMWSRLIRYVKDGQYEIDNNLVENSIRPVALGRKNYLFAGSHEGARRAAMMYSFLITCKLRGINPFDWLSDVFSQIQDTKISQLEALLPQNWTPSPKKQP